jgi:class 3 adenylate cyclase
MRRREFIVGLGATAWPLTARAQQPATPVVGLLDATNSSLMAALKLGLSQSGWVEGRTVAFEHRTANGEYDRLPALANELVRRRVAAIGAITPRAALAAKAATTTIPIVFSLGSDPVKDGLVASLNRPGGNVTGVTFFNNLLTAKRLELLHEVVPNAAIALLLNPNNANAELELHEAEIAARRLGLQLVVIRASNEREVRSALRLKVLHDRALGQAADLESWNQILKHRVAEQVAELESIGRLRRFLPPQIAQLVVSADQERMLQSHRRDVTVLFCELRGFSAFSELAEPEEVILVQREYHAAMGRLVDKYEGTVDSFTGDGLLVIFNDPVPCPDPSMRAVQMAIEMRDELATLSEKWGRSGHDIDFGIGIAHGYATLGTIGYEGRFQYSVMGKVANLASRLCDKATNGQILIDISVFSAVESRADVESTEEAVLKGFSRPIKTFNVRKLHC